MSAVEVQTEDESSVVAARDREGISIVVPVFNEEEAVVDVICRLEKALDRSGLPYEIVAVDDGSTDDSCGVICTTRATLIRHPLNRGYGAALKTGIRRARYERVAIIDADGTYAPESLLALLEKWGDNDMVVGARTGSQAAIPLARRPVKWVLNQVANYLTGVRIPDLNSGLRIFKKSVALEFFNLLPSGFSFTTTITLAMLSNDYLVEYVAIPYYPRVGTSKIHPVKDTVNFLGLILRTFMYYAPLKVFVPVSLLFLVTGFIKTAYDVVLYRNVATSDLLLLVTGTIIGMMGLLADLIDKRR